MAGLDTLNCGVRQRDASVGEWSVVSVSDGDKYKLEERGLRIEKLDLRDNGTYECRAEVSSHGNLKVRTVSVDVQCQSVTSSLLLLFQYDTIRYDSRV